MKTDKRIRVALFIAPHCNQCHAAKQKFRQIAEKIGRDCIDWCEVDVLDELDYAVKLGVLSSLAIAIDGRLVFATPPSTSAFRKSLTARLKHTGPCSQ